MHFAFQGNCDFFKAFFYTIQKYIFIKWASNLLINTCLVQVFPFFTLSQCGVLLATLASLVPNVLRNSICTNGKSLNMKYKRKFALILKQPFLRRNRKHMTLSICLINWFWKISYLWSIVFKSSMFLVLELCPYG